MQICVKGILFAILAILTLSSYSFSDKLDVIIIDPGHGGKDPGTTGVTGTKEKDINLAISLKFFQLITDAFPEMKVILTRSADDFIEVKDRSSLANVLGGKLFISIHSNHKKQEESEKSGFEIYLLNRERFPEAVEIIMNENKVLKVLQDSKDPDANFIFSTLAGSAFLKYGRSFASLLNVELQSSSEMISRGIMQSGFWVLLGSSMPSVLVECGYLSDKKDESYLGSEAGQNAFAQSLFTAFTRYKTLYEIY